MPEPTAAPAAPVVPDSTLKPGSPDGKGNAPDAVQELKDTLAKLAERVQDQSRIIANLQKAPKPEPAKVEDPLTERVKQLETKQAKVDEREKTQRKREALQKLESALVENGVDPKQAPRFAQLTYLEHESAIVVDDNFNVSYREAEDKTAALNTWVQAFLQTEAGKVYLPPVRNPSVKTGAAASGKTKLTKAELQAGSYDTAKLKAGQYELVD
jgi:hypothetical protein